MDTKIVHRNSSLPLLCHPTFKLMLVVIYVIKIAKKHALRKSALTLKCVPKVHVLNCCGMRSNCRVLMIILTWKTILDIVLMMMLKWMKTKTVTLILVHAYACWIILIYHDYQHLYRIVGRFLVNRHDILLFLYSNPFPHVMDACNS